MGIYNTVACSWRWHWHRGPDGLAQKSTQNILQLELGAGRERDHFIQQPLKRCAFGVSEGDLMMYDRIFAMIIHGACIEDKDE